MSEIYHILNRGIDKRKIFLDKQDYFRFIHDLFEFNDQNILNTTFRDFQKNVQKNSMYDVRRRAPRKLLANVHAFCLMPNHYHLLISPQIENGVSRFMHKIGTGYVKYFNQKYNRKGTIFESKYKSILISEEPHFYHLPYYIHFNPLDLKLKFKTWRDGILKDCKKAIEYLNNYRWSSHLDYLGKKNFPSVINKTFLTDVFGGVEEYKKSIEQRLKDLELGEIEKVLLE